MNTSTTLTLAGMLLFATDALSQDIATDSKGKGVFPFQAARKGRVEFSPRDFSFNIQWRNTTWISTVRRDSVLELVGVEKKSFWFLQPAALNLTDLFVSSAIGSLRPGGRLRFGYQRTVSLIDAKYKGWTYSSGLSINLGADNLKLYDPLDGTSSKRYPLIGGADVNVTLFPPASEHLLIAITGSYSYGYNDTELLNFKELAGAGLTANGVAFDKFDGKQGTLREGVNGGRMSLGFPILIAGHVSPVPYVAVVAREFSYPTTFAGVFVNFHWDPISFRSLKADNTFGMGVDWTMSGGVQSNANFFVRGNFSFGMAQ